MESGILPFKCEQKHCPAFDVCELVPTQLRVGDQLPKEVILFIGEAPGRNEASEGLPFIGRSGDLLRDTIRKSNSRGVSVAYANVARYWPKNENGDTVPPDPEAQKACFAHLKADVEKLKPSKIVVLGGTALKSLLPKAPGIAKARGQHFDHPTLGKIFATYRPAYILRKQSNFSQWKDDLRVALGSDKRSNKLKRWSAPFKHRLLTDIEEVEKWVDEVLADKSIKVIACDTETENLNKRYGNTLGTFQFCTDGKNAVVIPYHHPQAAWWPEESKRLNIALKKLFTSPDPPFRYWVFHGMDFDFRMLFNFGLGITKFNRPLLDSMALAYAQNENRVHSGIDRPYKLENLIRDYLKVEKYGDDPEIEKYRNQGRLLEIELERLAAYGAGDAVYTWRLFWYILERAKEEGYKKTLLKLCEHWFEPATRMNSIMSSNGFWVDIEQLRLLKNPKKSPIVKRMEEIDREWKHSKAAQKANKILRKKALGGEMKPLFSTEGDWVFDINKDEHKLTLFFDVMQLEPLDFGAGKWNGKPRGKLDKAFQEKHEGIKEVDLLHEYSGLKKLRTSYVTSIFKFVDPRNENPDGKDGRVRSSFKLTSTDTGRSSCSEPNLQQVPRADNWAKKEIKNMFSAEPGTALIQLDFMTSEVRWWGILAQCSSLAKAFEGGKRARQLYQEACEKYAAKNPKLKYPVLAAGVSILDEKPKDLLLARKHSKKALVVANKLMKRDPDFKALCEAKKYAGIAGDIHKSTASQMYQVAIETVTKPQRNDTKQIVFGSMFGRGAKAIAQQLGIDKISLVEGRIRDFFNQFKEAEEWFFNIENFGEQNGYVESPIGRRRRLLTFQVGLGDKGEIARAKRLARNAPIQGISSDGAFLGAAMFNDWLIEEGKWHVHPTKECWLLQDVVHDSLVMQVPLEEVPEAIKAVRPFFTTKLMERMRDVWGVNFNIPLEIDFELGLRWGDLASWDGTQVHLDYMMNKLRKQNAERLAKAA